MAKGCQFNKIQTSSYKWGANSSHSAICSNILGVNHSEIGDGKRVNSISQYIRENAFSLLVTVGFLIIALTLYVPVEAVGRTLVAVFLLFVLVHMFFLIGDTLSKILFGSPSKYRIIQGVVVGLILFNVSLLFLESIEFTLINFNLYVWIFILINSVFLIMRILIIRNSNKIFEKTYLTPLIIFCGILFVLICVNNSLVSIKLYDNYSHWLISVIETSVSGDYIYARDLTHSIAPSYMPYQVLLGSAFHSIVGDLVAAKSYKIVNFINLLILFATLYVIANFVCQFFEKKKSLVLATLIVGLTFIFLDQEAPYAYTDVYTLRGFYNEPLSILAVLVAYVSVVALPEKDNKHFVLLSLILLFGKPYLVLHLPVVYCLRFLIFHRNFKNFLTHSAVGGLLVVSLCFLHFVGVAESGTMLELHNRMPSAFAGLFISDTFSSHLITGLLDAWDYFGAPYLVTLLIIFCFNRSLFVFFALAGIGHITAVLVPAAMLGAPMTSVPRYLFNFWGVSIISFFIAGGYVCEFLASRLRMIGARLRLKQFVSGQAAAFTLLFVTSVMVLDHMHEYVDNDEVFAPNQFAHVPVSGIGDLASLDTKVLYPLVEGAITSPEVVANPIFALKALPFYVRYGNPSIASINVKGLPYAEIGSDAGVRSKLSSLGYHEIVIFKGLGLKPDELEVIKF